VSLDFGELDFNDSKCTLLRVEIMDTTNCPVGYATDNAYQNVTSHPSSCETSLSVYWGLTISKTSISLALRVATNDFRI
jgi:hypothetical protein